MAAARFSSASAYTPFDVPGSSHTRAYGIEGGRVEQYLRG